MIVDDGPGIPADPPKGTGLSIVRALVRDELGGSLDLDSAAARALASASDLNGCSTAFAVPDCGGCASSSPKTRLSSGSTCAHCSSGRSYVLVAEAHDGEEAIALAREHGPDLAIMDVKMPRLDGIDAARQMLRTPDPIVMLTAFGQRELVDRAAEAGVYGYLVKPFREQDVVPAIQTARARHEELAAVRAEADSLAEALVAARRSSGRRAF